MGADYLRNQVLCAKKHIAIVSTTAAQHAPPPAPPSSADTFYIYQLPV